MIDHGLELLLLYIRCNNFVHCLVCLHLIQIMLVTEGEEKACINQYVYWNTVLNLRLINIFIYSYIREPVKKKKVWKIPHLGGGGPDRVIFHIFFF